MHPWGLGCELSATNIALKLKHKHERTEHPSSFCGTFCCQKVPNIQQKLVFRMLNIYRSVRFSLSLFTFQCFRKTKDPRDSGIFLIKEFYFAAPILNIFVPQAGHFPVTAGLPFFIFISCASFISFFALHFTQ